MQRRFLCVLMVMGRKEITIALAGNPNVGKSTVFNALTGLKQHTGNWPRKSVESAFGTYTYNNKTYTLVDLPGTYSLFYGYKNPSNESYLHT